jgi:hypothetical protein
MGYASVKVDEIEAARKRVRRFETATKLLRSRLMLLRARAELAHCRRAGLPTTHAVNAFYHTLDSAAAAQRDMNILCGTWKCEQCSTTIPHTHLAPSSAARWQMCPPAKQFNARDHEQDWSIS